MGSLLVPICDLLVYVPPMFENCLETGSEWKREALESQAKLSQEWLR